MILTGGRGTSIPIQVKGEHPNENFFPAFGAAKHREHATMSGRPRSASAQGLKVESLGFRVWCLGFRV